MNTTNTLRRKNAAVHGFKTGTQDRAASIARQ
jgi:hypothetical protein